MTRIAYFVHGRGRGHATRARSAIPALQQAGFEVEVHAGGDALPWLQPLGEVLACEVIRPGAAGPLRWRARVRRDLRALRERPAAALVTDGDGPCLVAARVLGIPAVAVGHGLLFAHARLPPLPPRLRVPEMLNAASSSVLAQRRVAVHFLPAEPRDPRTTIARPDFAADFAAAVPGELALAYFRDDNGAALLRALSPLWSRAGVAQVLCFHAPGKRDLPAIDGVRYAPLSPEAFRAELPRARAVIGSAGSNLLAECVHLHRPLLCQYLPGDREQAMNAALATRARVAEALRSDEDPAATAARFVARLAADDFATIDLAGALPPASEAIARAVQACLPVSA